MAEWCTLLLKTSPPCQIRAYYSIYSAIVSHAQQECGDSDDPTIPYLRPLIPAEEFRNATELDQFRRIRERIIDPPFEALLLLHGACAQIQNAKPPSTFRYSGLAFESSLNQDNPNDFGIIHILRDAHCKYKGAAFWRRGAGASRHINFGTYRLRCEFSASNIGSESDPSISSQTASTPDAIEVSGAIHRIFLAGPKLIYFTTAISIIGMGLRFFKSLREFYNGPFSRTNSKQE